MEHDNHHKKQEFNLDDQQTGFMMGAVLGALVGGAAAMLLSPKSGKEMREIVKKYSKDLESEAYELAKESRGVAKSFKTVLEEGAVDVMEQAPEKIEQAGYQAQQLAEDLTQRFDSARDVVAELAEAFRSGWEEYGENESEEDDIQRSAPALFNDDEVFEKQVEVAAEKSEEHTSDVAHHGRRRSHAATTYSMHVAPVETAKENPHKVDSDKVTEKPEKPKTEEEKSPSKTHKEVEVAEKQPKKEEPAHHSYTTRIVEEPRKVVSTKDKKKADDEADKKSPSPRKKLLFRRGS